jgi:hypothetical protein
LLLGGIYHYYEWYDLPPISTHYWRQGDCVAQALYYYRNGMHFFEPGVMNLQDGDCHSVGEFPILYYIAGGIFHLTGQENWVLRLLDLFIYWAGLFALHRLSWYLTKDKLTSICLPLLFFASPLLVFYGLNFLPNVPSLGLIFCSWLCFYHYYIGKNVGWFYACCLILLLCGLLKPTVLITYLAIGVVWLYDVFKVKRGMGVGIFPQGLKLIPAFLMVVVPLVFWRIWVDHYTLIHHSKRLFLAEIMPIWKADKVDRQWIFNHVLGFWSKSYFAPFTHVVVLVVSFLNILLYRSQHKLLFAFYILLMFGVVSVGLLWYLQFGVHDYYAVELFVFPVISFLLFGNYLHRKTRIMQTWVYKGLLILFLVGNISYTRKEILYHRYGAESEWIKGNNPSIYKMKGLQSFLRGNGVLATDTILSYPDYTPDASLYTMNQPGVSTYNGYCGQHGPKCVLSHIVQFRPKYLVVTDMNSEDMKGLRGKLPEPIGVFDGSIYLYRISDLVVYFREKGLE